MLYYRPTDCSLAAGNDHAAGRKWYAEMGYQPITADQLRDRRLPIGDCRYQGMLCPPDRLFRKAGEAPPWCYPKLISLIATRARACRRYHYWADRCNARPWEKIVSRTESAAMRIRYKTQRAKHKTAWLGAQKRCKRAVRETAARYEYWQQRNAVRLTIARSKQGYTQAELEDWGHDTTLLETAVKAYIEAHPGCTADDIDALTIGHRTKQNREIAKRCADRLVAAGHARIEEGTYYGRTQRHSDNNG